MKYKSELIKDIVDTGGHKKSSLHYESECIETWIEEAKGGYPKLCDYQSEWLSYINKFEGGETEQPNPEPPIGEFPYVVLSDVTDATIDNVVPYAYKSAILSGSTLVNLCKLSGMNKPNPNRKDVVDIPLHHLKENTQYTVILNVLECSDRSITAGFLDANGSSWKGIVRNISISSDIKMLITTGTGLGNKLRIHNNTSTGTLTVKNAIVLEGVYTNQDIPYFEDMQSVKMPVLTTSNEDGTKTNILSCLEPVELGSVGEVKDELDLLTGKITQRTDIRPYQESDESNSEVLTDMTNTRYKLAQEVVKTVDLSVTNQDGNTLSRIKPIEGTMHISTEGTPFKPAVSMEIPVEAITQNLASFIKEE